MIECAPKESTLRLQWPSRGRQMDGSFVDCAEIDQTILRDEQSPAQIRHLFLQGLSLGSRDGRPYLIFRGETEQLYMPLALLGFLHQELDQLAISYVGSLDALQRADIATPRTWRTASTEDGRPAIVIDQGLASQQAFAMDPDVAVHFGEHLAAIGAQGLRPINKH